MAIIAPAFVYLNYVMLPKVFPSWVKPHPVTRALMLLCTAAYVAMALAYVVLNWRHILELLGG
jgi:hypothetical protein